jgi:hypothetical protein
MFMNILQIVSFVLLVVILMGMFARIRPYSTIAKPGKTLSVIPLTILSKIWINRFSLGALATGLILTSVLGWLPISMLFMVLAFTLVLLLMPMKLTLTSQGMALGETSFRQWKDFSGVKASKMRLELQHSSMFMRVNLFFRPSKIPPILKTIENHIPAILPNA